jgi:hypothetical protein
VGSVQTTIVALLQFLKQVASTAWIALTHFEHWLRDQLQPLGLPHAVQTVILVGVTIVLVVGALRLFAGLIRVAAVLILLLVVLHLLLPLVHA